MIEITFCLLVCFKLFLNFISVQNQMSQKKFAIGRVLDTIDSLIGRIKILFFSKGTLKNF